MRIAVVSMLALLSCPLWAQTGAQLNMKELEKLEAKADEVVSVNLEGESLDLGRKLLLVRKGVTAPVKELVNGLKGIYMRRFWFGKKKGYDEEDTADIHKQMKGPGWVPMIDVRNRKKPEGVTVYSYVENDEVAGYAVVSEEEQEVTVVNIVGQVDLEALAALGEQMNIPAMKIATIELPTNGELPSNGETLSNSEPPATSAPAQSKEK